MPEEDSPVLDWDRIVHKNVRSNDGQDAGNIDAVDAVHEKSTSYQNHRSKDSMVPKYS
jgi:hypothetical protein